eukprot:jgi/Bigna1/55797/estExt_Genewise1Plus.C_710032
MRIHTGLCRCLHSLELSAQNFVTLHKQLFELTSLRRLVLSRNALKSISPSIGRLESLENLVLLKNEIASLPPEIGQLKNLRKLSAGLNKLISLPGELSSLSKLETLGLTDNQLTSIPKEIGQLKELKRLFVSRNKLTSLPSEIKGLQRLEWLDISLNQISILTPNIGHLVSLRRLWLHHNQLTTLPREFSNLTNLSDLYLRPNLIKRRALPAELNRMQVLKKIWVKEGNVSNIMAELRFKKIMKPKKSPGQRKRSVEGRLGRSQEYSLSVDSKSGVVGSRRTSRRSSRRTWERKETLMKGWMEKSGNTFFSRRWQRRFFTLDAVHLSWFKNEEDTNPCNVLALEDVEELPFILPDHTLQLKSVRKTYRLRAHNLEETRTWSTKIKYALEKLQSVPEFEKSLLSEL